MRKLSLILSFLAAAAVIAAALADGPADNIPEKVRPVPPPGIAVPDADRAALEAGLSELGADIQRLKSDAKAAALLPDVRIYHNAVRYALQFGESDWAIVDTATPPNSRYPGKIAAAGFFSEDWELTEPAPK